MREGDPWGIQGLPCSTGKPMTVQVSTAYIDVGAGDHLPGRLLAEVRGEAVDLAQAITAFGQSLNLLGPMIAVATNAHVPIFQFDLAYDNTPEDGSHELTQWFRQGADPLAQPRQRPIDPQVTGTLLNTVLHHPEGARADRACVQYQEALGAWTSGSELRAVMHLWMAVEAMTKAFLRTECTRQGVDEDGLCAAWAIEKRELDATARRQLIFHGDGDCYNQAKKTSDGLEHMFEDFPKLHKQAAACRDCTAGHVRRAIFELVELPAAELATATSDPYDKPLALTVLDRTFLAELTGHGDRLAREGFAHPQLIDWDPRIKSVKAKPDDAIELVLEDNFRVAISEEATCRPHTMGTQFKLDDVQVQTTRARTNSGEPPAAAQQLD